MSKPLERSIDKQEEAKLESMKNRKSMCEREREKVKGIFRFHECEGGILDFVFRAYKWDSVEKYHLTDGQIYEIPLGVAKHLNKNGWYPEHSCILDKDGNPTIRVAQKKRRFSFQSMDFVDMEEIGQEQINSLVTVTPI